MLVLEYMISGSLRDLMLCSQSNQRPVLGLPEPAYSSHFKLVPKLIKGRFGKVLGAVPTCPKESTVHAKCCERVAQKL